MATQFVSCPRCQPAAAGQRRANIRTTIQLEEDVMATRKRAAAVDVGLVNTEQLTPEFSARMLLTVFDAPLFIRRNFVDITGSITAALMLTYAVDLYSNHEPVVRPDGEGWFKLTADEWERETGMTRSEQATARRALRERGLFEEQRIGMPARVLTRVDFDTLGVAMQMDSESREARRALDAQELRKRYIAPRQIEEHDLR
ncbi:hypothetical protein [Burkholderia gladioli]|uniref:hypothetical protein n=1 Tax=Burkholderia gladioli TaxID=28095 RepID=UPI001641D6DC|nr:hypothetical protein [Burkholderia gladioli]